MFSTICFLFQLLSKNLLLAAVNAELAENLLSENLLISAVNAEQAENSLSVIKRYILLFELLLKISFHIPMQICEDARKLAVEWKAKLRADKENSLEVLAFLQFLVVYDLIWSFDEDKTLKFLEMISQHKEAPELFRILSDKLPGKFSLNLIS